MVNEYSGNWMTLKDTHLPHTPDLSVPSLSISENIFVEWETQSVFTCSKLTIETLEQGVKYVQS